MSDSKPGGPLAWVFTRREVDALIEAMITSQRVVLDLETTGLNEYATERRHGCAARIVLASLTLPQKDRNGEWEWDGTEPTTWILPLSHPQSPFLGQWRAVMRRVASTIVEHQLPVENQNMKFDARWIYAHTGVDLAGHITWDTRLSAHLLDENSSTSLKEVAPRTFDVPRWDDVDLTYPGAAEDADLWQLGEYAARDTYWTWRLIESHRQRMFLGSRSAEWPEGSEEVEDARLGKYATWVTMPMVRSLTRIEQNGIRVDADWTRTELSNSMQTAKQCLDEMAGMYGQERANASTASASHWFREFTEKAAADGRLRVAAMTDKGNPQWTKGVLTKQARAGYDVAELILRQRDAEKRSQFLASWLEHLGSDGRIHAMYNPASVVTGRTSSSSPNMQQVSKPLRQAFVPSEGCYLADFDFSQVELRVAAFIARDTKMIEAFQRGDDLHRQLAARLTRKTLEEVNAEERQKGKAANFGLLFGLGSFGFKQYAEDAYGVVMSEEEAAKVYNVFFEMWPGIKNWHAKTVSYVEKYGQVVSPLGRVRRLPDIWDGNPQRVKHAENAALNAPVQSMASDLLQIAAAEIQGLLPLPGAEVPGVRIVATVHDSLVVEVPADCWEETVGVIRERMTNLDEVLAWMGVEFDLPLEVEATVGTRWGLSDVGEIG